MPGAAAGGAFAGILVANNIKRLTEGMEKARTTWKELEARGLALGSEEATGLAKASGTERPVLTGTIDTIECAMRIVSDFVHYAHTRVTAKPLAGVRVEVGVYPNPKGLYGWLRLKLGQDIEVGDAEFDQAFLITADPATAALTLLQPEVREDIRALAGSTLAGFTYTKDEVAVTLVGVETDATVLGVALDLALLGARWQL